MPLNAVAAEAMPAGTDAVIPLGIGNFQAGAVDCVEDVAPGDNVDVQGAVASAGTVLATAGTRLSPRHVGLLIGAKVSTVAVVRRPACGSSLQRPP